MTEPLPPDLAANTPAPAAKSAPSKELKQPVPEPASPAKADESGAAKGSETELQRMPSQKTPAPVSGRKLEPAPSLNERLRMYWIGAGVLFLLLLIYGFVRRKGSMQ